MRRCPTCPEVMVLMDASDTNPKRSRLLRSRPLAGVALGTGLALTAVLLNPFGTSSATAATGLPAYTDCAAFEAGMRDLALPRVSAYGLSDQVVQRDEGGGLGIPNPLSWFGGGSDEDTMSAPASGDVAAQAPERLSGGLSTPDRAVGTGPTGTNVQEQGVDEADLAKTDGNVLVTVVDGALQVVDVTGTTPRPRGRVDLGGLRPSELLLSDDTVLVISSGSEYADRGAAPDMAYPGAAPVSTALSVVDISDPDRPAVTGSERIGARYLSARLSDGIVRVVLSARPQLSFAQPGGAGRDYDDAIEANQQVVREATAADWIPTRRVVDREARSVAERPLLECTDIRHPESDSGADLLTVLSIDTRVENGLRDLTATAVVASGDLVYASTEKLFVATTVGGWGGGDAVGVAAPQSRGGGTLTAIHAFDITGARAEYLASGEVDGYLCGRWAMSERDGLLRLVTTSAAPWNRGGSTQTGVVVLDTKGNRLDEVGRVDGMGLTETVRAVRWFDDLAAIVTFRQTDPLYLVDLSNPTAPRVRGELKIPGYSAYLHPIGDRRLLGVGQDATGSGQTTGLQVSSFDILDVTDPRRTDALGLGEHSTSSIEQDPRGFVYLPEDRLAVFPMYARGSSCRQSGQCLPAGQQGELPYGPGLVSVRVAKDGKLARIASWDSHLQGDLSSLKAMPLPGRRLAVLDGSGVAILDAATLAERGYSRF